MGEAHPCSHRAQLIRDRESEGGCIIPTPIKCETVIKDNINWRRHRTACPYYREDWKVEDGLYRCICLMGTPPETREEQDLCMRSRSHCWRLKSSQARAARE